MSDSLRPCGMKHTRPLCPSLSLKICSSSCPLHWWCHPGKLILWYSLPAKGPSQLQGLFQWVSCSHQMTKILEFQLQHQILHEYSGLISLKTDWFDLLAVQGTLRSLLQHHSLKTSIAQRSAFFMVQLSQLYMTPGKTIALAIGTFVGRIMSLLFNTLFRFVIVFLPRSKCLLTSGCSHYLKWF